MLLNKFTVAIAAFFSLAMAQTGLISPADYIARARQMNGPADIEAQLEANGAKPQIDAALQKAMDDNNAHDGIACDAITCQTCIDCRTARVDVSIELATTWATCAIACAFIVDCPAAIAAATVASAGICAKFCNDQGQGIACNMDCAWATCPVSPLLRRGGSRPRLM